MNGNPIVFRAPAGGCTGWFHPAEGRTRSVGVLLCNPLGYEALCAHAAYGQLARKLAAAGFDVLRFDYHGTGDSDGGDADPHRVQAWEDSVDAARDELKRLSGARRLVFAGMRLGATLAVQAAGRAGGVDGLVLWAPCPTGRAFVREMRAANASRGSSTPSGGDGAMEALGSLFTADTLHALGGLDASNLTQPPARRALFIGRDDFPGEGPLPERYRALGTEVATTTWKGYADMMAQPREARVEASDLGTLLHWFDAAYPRLQDAGPRLAPPWPQGFSAGAWHEAPVAFGPRSGLYGVVSAPTGVPSGDPSGQRARTAVLMLNVGGNYHVGCNRIYVKAARELAASGYQVLRFDVAGIGDSDADSAAGDNVYRHESVADVRAAIDLMVQRGCDKFWLLGICSGSYLAFEAALQDPRVTGQMLLNSRLLEWDAAANGPWQTAMLEHYKSTRYYRQQLLRPEVYTRIVRGQVDVLGIGQRMWGIARQRIQRSMQTLLRRAPREGVLQKMRHLSDRGVNTFVVMSAQDDGLDYIEFHLGPRGSLMRRQPGFRMTLIEDSDHTFSTVASQRAVIDLVRQHLDTADAAHQPSGAVSVRVATT